MFRRGASTYSALTSTAQWQFAQTGNLVLPRRPTRCLQVFDLSSSTAFRMRSVRRHRPPISAWSAGSWCCRGCCRRRIGSSGRGWTVSTPPTSWTSGINSRDFQDFPDGGIVRGVAGGEAGIIFQDQAIRSMSYRAGFADHLPDRPDHPGQGSLCALFDHPGRREDLLLCRPGLSQDRAGRRARADRPRKESTARSWPISTRAICNSSWARPIRAARGSTGPINPSRERSAHTTNCSATISCSIGFSRFDDRGISARHFANRTDPGKSRQRSRLGSLDALTLSLDAYATAVQPEIAQFKARTARIFPGHQSRGDDRKCRAGDRRKPDRDARLSPHHRCGHAVRLGAEWNHQYPSINVTGLILQ